MSTWFFTQMLKKNTQMLVDMFHNILLNYFNFMYRKPKVERMNK